MIPRSSVEKVWRRIEPVGLSVVGALVAVYGGWFLYIALGFGEVTMSDVDLRLLAGGVGTVTVAAGILAILRLRQDLVGSILGGSTAAAFALGAAQLARPEGEWSGLFPAAIFAALLFGFVTFRGAFRANRS